MSDGARGTGRRFGAVLTAPDAVAVESLEEAGVDALWVPGHITSPNGAPEAMVQLAMLAALSRRARIGTAILLLPLYPPAIVAKQIADLDRASNGRVQVGIGVGGEFENEFRACQVAISERGGRASEAIPLLRSLWSGEPVSHAGRFYSLADVTILPRPVQPGGPPIIVGGRSEGAMRRAAVHGDGWMPYLYSPRRFAESVARIKTLAAERERSLEGFRWIQHLYVAIDNDPAAARRLAVKQLRRAYGALVEPLVDKVVAHGDGEMVATRIESYAAAGAEEFVFVPLTDGRWDETLVRIFREVVPLVSRSQERA